jgi:hypothetical protein
LLQKNKKQTKFASLLIGEYEKVIIKNKRIFRIKFCLRNKKQTKFASLLIGEYEKVIIKNKGIFRIKFCSRKIKNKRSLRLF